MPNIQRFFKTISPSDTSQNIYSIDFKLVIKDNINLNKKINALDLSLQEQDKLSQFETHIADKNEIQKNYTFFNGIIHKEDTIIIPYSSEIDNNKNKLTTYLDWIIKVNKLILNNDLEIGCRRSNKKFKINSILSEADELYIKGSTSEQFLNNNNSYYIDNSYLRVANWNNTFYIKCNQNCYLNFIIGYYDNLKTEGEILL